MTGVWAPVPAGRGVPAGPLSVFFRRVVADRPADDAFIDRIIDDALARAGIADPDRRAVHVRLR
jgi:hypothetical protein